MNIIELTQRQVEASNRIAEALAESMAQDKECRRLMTKVYIHQITQLTNERNTLLAEVDRLTGMLDCLQKILAESIKAQNVINVR